MPELTDPGVAAALELLAALLPGAYLTDRLLHYQVSCHMVSLSLRHGVSSASALGFCAFGSAIGAASGRYLDAFRFGQAASSLVERHGSVAYRAKVLTLLAKLVLPWAAPLDACLKTLEEGLQDALRDGDLPYVCYSGLHSLNLRLFRASRSQSSSGGLGRWSS